MKIDLCKMLGVEEGEEFILETKDGWFNDLKYKIENNIINTCFFIYDNIKQPMIRIIIILLNKLRF